MMVSVYRSMNAFEKNIIEIYGDKAHQWLRALPDVITDLARQWHLSHLLVVENLSYNFVMAGKQGHKEIILKFVLDEEEFKRQAQALTAFDGHGCVKLLSVSREHQAMVMEKATPGDSLKTYFPHQEKEAAHIVCDLIKKLHGAPVDDLVTFPSLKDWFSTLQMKWNLPSYHLKKAYELSKSLWESTSSHVLLHGDLHHDNILRYGDKDWLAIDPKGVVGDPYYEVSVYIYNPIDELYNHPDAKDIMLNRLRLFADILDLDFERLKNWCYVQSVLATCWALEDNITPHKHLFYVEMLESL